MQWTDEEQEAVDQICAALGATVWRDNDIRAFDIANALLPVIAAARRQGRQSQQTFDLDAIARLESDSPMGGWLRSYDAFEAIRTGMDAK